MIDNLIIHKKQLLGKGSHYVKHFQKQKDLKPSSFMMMSFFGGCQLVSEAFNV